MAFESITDERILELLKLPKRVVNPTTRAKDKGVHEQYNYKVQTIGEIVYELLLYTRQNLCEGMEDAFSCGLSWAAPNGEVLTLIRYNGSNHPHKNHLEGDVLVYEFHIHTATERYIRANRKPEGYAETTDRYRTLKGALHCLVEDCNISGITTEPDMPTLF